MAVEDLTELMEELTGIPPKPLPRRLTKRERKEQAQRIKRFLALPPLLQEGILKYGENIREAYDSSKTSS